MRICWETMWITELCFCSFPGGQLFAIMARFTCPNPNQLHLSKVPNMLAAIFEQTDWLIYLHPMHPEQNDILDRY